MKSKLLCNGNPRTTGIEDKKGNCNLEKFKEHVLKCPLFAALTKNLLKEIEKEMRYNLKK